MLNCVAGLVVSYYISGPRPLFKFMKNKNMIGFNLKKQVRILRSIHAITLFAQ